VIILKFFLHIGLINITLIYFFCPGIVCCLETGPSFALGRSPCRPMDNKYQAVHGSEKSKHGGTSWSV